MVGVTGQGVPVVARNGSFEMTSISVRQRTLEAKLRAAESLARIYGHRADASAAALAKSRRRVEVLKFMLDELART
jgi:hypothetical protein